MTSVYSNRSILSES